MRDRLDALLATTDGWAADPLAVAVVGPEGPLASRGDPTRRFRWASVTKLLTAWVVHLAADRGLLELDEPAGPPGATIRHLLAHASGLPFEGEAPVSAPGRRRIYSNPGYDLLGAIVAERTGEPFDAVMRSWLLGPLGMGGTELVERPSRGLEGPLEDLVGFARELLRPTLIPADAARVATAVALPGLSGVVPGIGNFEACDWGLGPELHGAKRPHWMGEHNSPETFGHFGRWGSCLWVDPVADLALVVLTDREFGGWALQAWPQLSDAVLEVST